jgi:hypothetical protein
MAIFEEQQKKREHETNLREQTNLNKQFVDQNLKINRKFEKEKILLPKKKESEKIQLGALQRQINERNKSSPHQKSGNSKRNSSSSKTKLSTTPTRSPSRKRTSTSTPRFSGRTRK